MGRWLSWRFLHYSRMVRLYLFLHICFSMYHSCSLCRCLNSLSYFSRHSILFDIKITQPVTSRCIITFQKSFINFKSTQNITLKSLDLDVNIACTHASVVLVIFHYHMLQNKQSDRHSLYSMTSVIVFFAYPIKLNISTRKRVTKILPKKLHYSFN